jgi:hypothetical protein
MKGVELSCCVVGSMEYPGLHKGLRDGRGCGGRRSEIGGGQPRRPFHSRRQNLWCVCVCGQYRMNTPSMLRMLVQSYCIHAPYAYCVGNPYVCNMSEGLQLHEQQTPLAADSPEYAEPTAAPGKKASSLGPSTSSTGSPFCISIHDQDVILVRPADTAIPSIWVPHLAGTTVTSRAQQGNKGVLQGPTALLSSPRRYSRSKHSRHPHRVHKTPLLPPHTLQHQHGL